MYEQSNTCSALGVQTSLPPALRFLTFKKPYLEEAELDLSDVVPNQKSGDVIQSQ